MKLKLKKKKQPIKESYEEESYKENFSQIKTDRLMKGGRIILWAVILFLLLRGIVSILAPGSEQRLEQIVTDYQADAKLRESIQVEAAAFAEDFAYEYYTFSGKMNSDYEKRTSKYLAKNLDIKSPVSGKIATTVDSVSVTQIKYVSSADYDIDVHLIVKYIPQTEGELQSQKDIYIRVPITKDKNSNYAVTSLPAYIPKVKTANIAVVESYTGEQVSSSQVQSIKETLNSFFKAYYTGTKTEISYYLIGSSEIASGIGGSVEFNKIDYIMVYKDAGSGDYLVDATFTVLDNQQQIQQRLFLRLQYSKDRYYIKNINTRPL